jgi:DNA-nicking Smr family endonuclease
MVKKRIHDLTTEQIDAADAGAFRAAVRDVKPLPQQVSPLGLAAPKRRARKPVLGAAENLDALMPLIAPQATEESAGALSFARGGVGDRVLRRLRRGLYPIEDELDLHGLTQSAARDRLANFLSHARDAGRRCVRVIHGKGYRSGARGPVLKTAVNLWLRRHGDVMAFTSARVIDGGTGAVYVLLRA